VRTCSDDSNERKRKWPLWQGDRAEAVETRVKWNNGLLPSRPTAVATTTRVPIHHPFRGPVIVVLGRHMRTLAVCSEALRYARLSD